MSDLPPGGVVWITGHPASGKSTLAERVVEVLRGRGTVTLWLDSDDLRRTLTPDPTYSEEERDRFYGSLGHFAVLGAEGGAVAVVSATAPRRRYRDDVRERVSRFAEVFLECETEVLESRDPKGLYAGARRGEIERLPGLGAPYEAPTDPELRLDSGELEPEELAEAVLDWIEAAGLLDSRAPEPPLRSG
ncbi:MAG: adenylyl-sulfate kinase [Thermoanaerobaculia bacterium]|nr:adenylyl-sulfate kinase [Thermoanaerobaculia bacterium]